MKRVLSAVMRLYSDMIVDILVLAVLLISALIAFLRGCIREVLTIAGVAGGLLASYFFGPVLNPFISGWLGVKDNLLEGEEAGRLFGVLPYDMVASGLSYGAVFIVVVIILSVISHFLAEAAKSLGLGALDRTLGFIFGLVRGVLLLGLLFLPVHLFVNQDTKDSWFSGSKTYFYLESVSARIAHYIPSSAIDESKEEIERIEGVSETRKKLEEINLLKRSAPTNGAPGIDQSKVSGQDGYSEEFRDKMDQLFETQDVNE